MFLLAAFMASCDTCGKIFGNRQALLGHRSRSDAHKAAGKGKKRKMGPDGLCAMQAAYCSAEHNHEAEAPGGADSQIEAAEDDALDAASVSA